MVLAACASSGGSRAFVAPSGDTVTARTDVRPGNPPVYVVTVTNHSSVPIVVWSTTIYNCENVRDSCLPKQPNIRIPAFGSASIARIEPQNINQDMKYNFRWSWRPETARPGATAQTDSRPSSGPRELRQTDFGVLASRIAKIRPDPESLSIQPGERAEFEVQRVLVLDARDSVLGFTRWVRYSVSYEPGMQIIPAGMSANVVGRRPARGKVAYKLAPEVQSLIPNEVPEAELPIIVAYRFDPDAPVFAGRVLDADARTPLACVRVGIEDSARSLVARSRADAAGGFSLRAPRPGTYKLRVETSGWFPWYSAPVAALAKEEKRDDHLVKFTEHMLSMRSTVGDAEYEPPRPAAVRFEPGTARPANRNTPVIHGVDLAGSAALPILSIFSQLPTQTLWAQFAVDTAGRVDTTSILLPATTPANTRAAIRYVLPRVRFSPGRDDGTAVCDLTRLQINISPR